ncbi:hypothetical protein JCM8097_000172 [Rhodosporidiobolus ruineniae]
MAGGGSMLLNRQALATTPPEVLNWYLWLAGVVISCAGGLHGWNNSNMSGITKMHDFKASFGLNDLTTTALADTTGWLTSIIVLGGMIGALVAAPFNDWFGRKKALWVAGLLYVVGSIIPLCTTSNVNMVIGGRALQGFTGGMSAVTGTMYLSEIAPKVVRGLLLGLFSLNTMLGIMLGYWANYGALLNISDDSHWQWRVALIVQIVPGVVILLFVPFIVESPRWLAWKDRPEDALKSLVRLRKLPAEHDYVLSEYSEIIAAVDAERGSSTTYWGLVKELVHDRTLARRFVLIMIVQIGYNLSGGNSITYYNSQVLSVVGIKGNDSSLFSGIYGTLKVVALFLYSLVCAERFGRRTMILVGSFGNTLMVAWLAIYLGALEGNSAGGWVSVAAICIFAIFYGLGWAPNAFGLGSEVFPNHLRAKLMSIAMGFQYLVNFLITRYFPNMTASITPKGPFIIFACVSAAIFVYLFFALPEVKGVAIEHQAELFGGHWWANGVRGMAFKRNRKVRDEEAANAATIHDPKATGGRAQHLEDADSTKEKARQLA